MRCLNLSKPNYKRKVIFVDLHGSPMDFVLETALRYDLYILHRIRADARIFWYARDLLHFSSQYFYVTISNLISCVFFK